MIKEKHTTSLRANPSRPATAEPTAAASSQSTQSASEDMLYCPWRTCGSRDRTFSGVGYVLGKSVIRSPAPYRAIHRAVIPTTVLLLTDPTATPIATTAAKRAEIVTTAARQPPSDRSSVSRKWNAPSMADDIAANVRTT